MESAVELTIKVIIKRRNGVFVPISFKPSKIGVAAFSQFVGSGTRVTVKNTQMGIRTSIVIPTICKTTLLPPIPKNKSDIAAATALAGELLGLQFIYLDKGSGSKSTVQNQMIKTVKKNIKIPLIVGGGINDRKDLENVWKAGADIAVIGTSVEKNLNNVLLFDKIYQ